MDKYELLAKLISFDTTSRNSNLCIIDYIKTYLQKYEIKSDLTYNHQKDKANLFATIPAYTDIKNGGLILSGHTDVVPVDNQRWDTDPFVATKIGNNIYGRGSCDMKGFLAVVLSLIPEIIKLKLHYPLHLAFSYDEEVGCMGVPLLIEDIINRGIHPSSCIVGEPTSMKPVVAHKGINVYTCKVTGKPAHSSLTKLGCNAIDYATKCIIKIKELADNLRTNGEADPYYDVPFSTISTNLINGGTASNIIPQYCEFTFDLRNLPHIDHKVILKPLLDYVASELLPKMQQEYKDASIEFTPITIVQGFIADESSKIVNLSRQITKEHDCVKVAYLTEAGLFQKNKINSIVCGPGDIAQAHKENEFISISQLELCEKFLKEMAHQLTLAN